MSDSAFTAPTVAINRNRKARIVATVGPASAAPEMIEQLFMAGVDVFRMNFSHGTHEGHKASYDAIRAMEQKITRPIGILADLQGPKLRVGNFADDHIMLEMGARFRLDCDATPGSLTRVQLPHPEIFTALKKGDALLLNDGLIRLRVEKAGKDFIDTVVIAGGALSDHKGVNLPDTVLDVSPLTPKDREDMHFALELGCDWIALSFVQRPADVREAKEIIQGRAGVMVKLEKPSALEELNAIVAECDALMVARGDLGVECPPENVPVMQKNIIESCQQAGKPVIVATQMLESMIKNSTPTRAEASDVANAVYEGADAVMLSAETAVGAYPLEAVSIMSRIINRVEADPLYRTLQEANTCLPEHTAADAITGAAIQCAVTINAAAVVTYTTTGSTAIRTARGRPLVPILCCTPKIATARKLALLWGTHCVETEDVMSFREMVNKAIRVVKQQGMAETGDFVVITAGVPFGTPGATNILRIATVD